MYSCPFLSTFVFFYYSYKYKDQFHKFWHHIIQKNFLLPNTFPIFDLNKYSLCIIISNSVNPNFLLNSSIFILPSFNFTSTIYHNTAHKVIFGKKVFIVFTIFFIFTQIIILFKSVSFSYLAFPSFLSVRSFFILAI